jgi:hypothetical protein
MLNKDAKECQPLLQQLIDLKNEAKVTSLRSEEVIYKYAMKGVAGMLGVLDEKITITPQGVLGFMTKGLKGTKTIPIRSITAIEFREAGAVVSGYLQFTIPGGNESRGGVHAAATDENTFMFAGKWNNSLAIEIKEFIEGKMREFHVPRSTQSNPVASLSDELQKLASLRDSGILSDQEFQSAKRRLIAD